MTVSFGTDRHRHTNEEQFALRCRSGSLFDNTRQASAAAGEQPVAVRVRGPHVSRVRVRLTATRSDAALSLHAYGAVRHESVFDLKMEVLPAELTVHRGS